MSGSEALAMLSHHYPGLFDDDPAMKARAENLAGRSYELVSFLVDVLGVKSVAARHEDNRAILARQATERLPVSRTYLPTLFVNLVGRLARK